MCVFAAPTIVQLLDITVNDTHVIVTWDAPADPNGAVSYNATVSGINLLNNASVLNPTTVFLSETEYIVPHTSVPYSEYTAVVVPQTSAGSGPSQTDTVRTLEAGTYGFEGFQTSISSNVINKRTYVLLALKLI